MARVLGIGGVFFKSENPERLRGWYAKHLGIESKGDEGASFRWRDADGGGTENRTAWSVFPASTKYFAPSEADFMLNYIVDDLDGMLAQLRRAGIKVDERVEEYDFGRFGWAMDPDGNRFELWEPRPRTASQETAA